MRKPLQKLLLLVGVLSVTCPWIARADEVTDISDTPEAWRMKSLRVGPAKLRTSLANDPDTIWIGHIANSSWVPKDRNGANVPNSARKMPIRVALSTSFGFGGTNATLVLARP